MPLILNLETATSVCSVALAKDGKLLSKKESNKGKNPSDSITLFIEEVIKNGEVAFSDLDAVSVSKGPGSYTGLRIGVSTAKGIAYALNKPLIALNTLQVMALGMQQKIGKQNFSNTLPLLFFPMIDARRMEVYCAAFDIHNACTKETSAEIIQENSFTEFLTNYNVIFGGDGAEKCKPQFSSHPNAHFMDAIFPSSETMISLSETRFENREFENLSSFEPYYLKDFLITEAKSRL